MLITSLTFFRFFQAFYLDSNFKPRTWSAEDDIDAMTRDAHSAVFITHFYGSNCITLSSFFVLKWYLIRASWSFIISNYLQALKILATLAAIRLDERIDNIEQVLFSSLMDGEINSTTLLPDTWDAVRTFYLIFMVFSLIIKQLVSQTWIYYDRTRFLPRIP